jgi:hypothetical protein
MAASMVFGGTVKNPSWIVGKWSNMMVSDLRVSVVWTFMEDSIYILKGIPSGEKRCISSEYSGYKQTSVLNNNLYKVIFSKDGETVEYEFKQIKHYGSEKPAFTYSLTINGIKKVDHSSSADLVFFKE